jgi:dipeptidyl-peptidase 4
MRIIFLFLALCLFLPISAQKNISLENIWVDGTFTAKSVPGFNFQKDGVHYTKLNEKTIEQYDLRTGQKSAVLFDAAALKDNLPQGWDGRFDGYEFNADETKLLLSVASQPIYRHSSMAYYYVYDLAKKTLTAVFEGKKQRYVTFSPDASKVAFVMDNDLYVNDLYNGNVSRITKDGKQNEIINGASDWVYEEEFVLVRAFEWSRDGQQIAYLRFDERAVPEMVMEKHTGGAYPELVKFKYPKVGEPNATVSAHIYDLQNGITIQVKIPPSEEAGGQYLPRIVWTPQNELCITEMNRHQNHLRLFLADRRSGNCRVLLEEKNKYYIDLQDVVFLNDGSGFLWQSEKSGFNHLYLYDMQGREKTALTKGDFELSHFYGLDEKNGLVYYQTAAKNAMQRELNVVKINGKGVKKISDGPGVHSAQFSSTFDYYVDTYSTLNSPPTYTVRSRKGKILRELEMNPELKAKQSEYGVLPAEFFKVPIKTETWSGDLNGFMIKPSAPQFQGQKLPVLMFVYGGPGSQQVMDQWKGVNYWWFQMLAQQGYVVACVDNRGTGGRGEEFKKMTYQQLGNMETQDQIAAAQHLGNLPFVDKNRIGIFGWSYGGYMSSLCMLKGPEVFKAGIAVAPVTNWKWYDSIYTERYMRTVEENKDGYEQNSPVNFADQLKGNYLLIHGLADDNVHFQHSAEMSNRLIAANKQFDAMIYPNKNHGIGGGNTRLHLYTLMTDFLNKNLKGNGSAVAKP